MISNQFSLTAEVLKKQNIVKTLLTSADCRKNIYWNL